MKKIVLVFLTVLCGIANAQTNYVLNFNGTSNYVDLGISAGSNIRSIEFWFKPGLNINPSISVTGYSFIERNNATQFNEYGFYIRGTDWPGGRGNLYFFMRDNGTLHEISSDSSSWASGTWYHVCGTIDATSGMKLYINGVLQTAADLTGTVAIPSSGEITTIGTWGDAFIRYYDGQMDELRFWNRTLSLSEIQSKMCYWLIPANETGLVGYWKMNEGSGPTIFDATVNSNNGAIIGATFVQDTNCFNGFMSINQIINQINISIYPNPFASEISVSLLKQNSKDATFIIKNILGQTVFINQENNLSYDYTKKLDLSFLSRGFYLLDVNIGGERAVKKIMKE